MHVRAQKVGKPGITNAMMFDVTKIHDAENASLPPVNPFANASTTPHAMIPFNIDELRAKLRVMVFHANKLQWDPEPDPHSGEYTIDLNALRAPTPDECASCSPADPALARDASRLRAYLNDFDLKQKAKADEERVRNIERLQRRLGSLAHQTEQWTDEIAKHIEAAERHAERLRDAEAYATVQLARTEIANIERKASDATSELEYLTRTNSNG